MKKKMNRIIAFTLMIILALAACSPTSAGEPKTQTTSEAATDSDVSSNKVVIYSGAEEYRNEYFLKRIKEEFPDYDITVEYMSTGKWKYKAPTTLAYQPGRKTKASLILWSTTVGLPSKAER